MFLVSVTVLSADNVRPAYLDRRGEVILPARYNRNRSYPVFVVVPPTGAYASQVVGLYGLDTQRQETFILLLPEGRPTRDEYLPDFMSFVGWYEERLLEDIQHLLENYSADPDRIYLGGYSLGGDLSWALSVRNPELFAGAVIAGSRTSHPVEDEALRTLRDRGFRAGFLIGNREDPLRYRGINVARQRFDSVGVDHIYEEYRGDHVIPPTPLFQNTILYVTDVASLPEPGPAGQIARRSSSPLVSHASRDRFALRAFLPADLDTRGISVPNDTEVSARVELPWERFYLRTTGTWHTSGTSTDERNRRLSQDLLVGFGGGRHFWGVGAGGDWVRDLSDGDAFRNFEVLLMHGMRNPWIVPAGTADPDRLDSLLILRYILPRGISAGPAAEQLFNIRGEYLLRIADLFVIDLGAGSYTVQNSSVEDLKDLSDALDHRLEWTAGLGLRMPSPFLWRVGYRGTSERPLPDGDPALRGTWTVSLEYSY
jgi:pimeloyl-ACP methyl ester carboxylesterase